MKKEIQLNRAEKEMLRLFNIASQIVLIEDRKLLEELGKR